MFGHEIVEHEHRTNLRNESVGGDEDEPNTHF